MSVLWPRLTASIAVAQFESVKTAVPAGSTSHPAQIYSAVGGRHVTPKEIESLAGELGELAQSFGFPQRTGDSERIQFDRRAAEIIHRHMDLSWSEAAARDVWSFLALIALPDLTYWRFGIRNIERWVGSDLTRHTWGRLWWQHVTFASEPGLLDALTESDLNQLLERRSIGGDARLVRALARGIINRENDSESRRRLIREVTAQMRRRLAFVDVRSLDEERLSSLVSRLIDRAQDTSRV